MTQETLDQAVNEAKSIARRASDWMAGKEVGGPYEAPGVAMAAIQGHAEKLA